MKLKRDTLAQLELSGWMVLTCHQPSYLFSDDGRKLKKCAVPSDPWLAILHDTDHVLTSTRFRTARGSSPDDAVLAALPERGSNVKNALAALETALDSLITVYQSVTKPV